MVEAFAASLRNAASGKSFLSLLLVAAFFRA